MIYKGGSPALRHVLRTLRVDTDCLFERVRIELEIFMKYVNTKDKLADVLTKGSFTAARWVYLCKLLSLGPRGPKKESIEHQKSVKRSKGGGAPGDPCS